MLHVQVVDEEEEEKKILLDPSTHVQYIPYTVEQGAPLDGGLVLNWA